MESSRFIVPISNWQNGKAYQGRAEGRRLKGLIDSYQKRYKNSGKGNEAGKGHNSEAWKGL